MAQLASLLVPIGDLPKPDLSWISNISKSLGEGIQQAGENKSFGALADRIGGAPAPAQQQGGFLSRLMGGNQASAPAPQAQGGRSMAISGIDPSIKSGIVSTANSLGIDPTDLATAISYETGGTFDPTKSGPTTQWGQHRGLIQFGEPQAKQYGVNWDDPINSQLGENGAVAKYLRDTGVKPGMSLMDIYSAINAGGVGRYGASDANNGGAPGTVADKVNSQMSGHRQRALALLGADAAAPQPQAGGNVVVSLDPSVGIPMPGASGQMRAGDPAPQLAAPTTVADAPQVAAQPPVQPAPQLVADNGAPSILAQGITPIQRGGVDPAMIQFMLRDPNLRQAGLQLWQQNATGKTSEPWQFVTLPDGTLARANQQTGQVEKVGQFAKPQDPISVSEGETILDPVTKQPIYQGKPKDPASWTEFQKAKGDGFQGTYADWEKVKVPGGVTVNNAAAEGATAKAAGEGLGKLFAGIFDEGLASKQDKANVGLLRSTLANSPDGVLGGLASIASDYGVNLGPNADQVQVAKSVIAKMVPAQRVPGSGTTSDRDLTMFQNALPRLSGTAEGNSVILDTLDSLADFKSAQADIVTQFYAGDIDQKQAVKALQALPDPFTAYKSFAGKNGGDTKIGIPSPKTDAEFNALPSGTIYIDPDDNKKYRKP